MPQSFRTFLAQQRVPSIAGAHRETQETLEIIRDAIRGLQGQVDRSRRMINGSIVALRSVGDRSVADR